MPAHAYCAEMAATISRATGQICTNCSGVGRAKSKNSRDIVKPKLALATIIAMAIYNIRASRSVLLAITASMRGAWNTMFAPNIVATITLTVPAAAYDRPKKSIAYKYVSVTATPDINAIGMVGNSVL